ncbi:hypothetical protein EPD60_05110 [Flaviaesturariibacter flavus]|uniref:Glycosyltransferase RgtA/B/C/D-like domain-containing protein n=1 Tax=Flaviaesturariibacter flavus TaxID=2502780 RepID=A0A4R1BJU6_9BACT|nr:hypothetical protein [Flaviaesturariibacter flavus]TCJ17574.1 hypothetical protein EPD60_05110 [Flaviaesturariibacter flavus]
MKYLLFVFYVSVFLWLLPRIRFFGASGLSKLQLRVLFLIKTAASLAYGYVGIIYMRRGTITDSWWMHFFGQEEFAQLKQHPGQFFAQLLHNPYPHGYGRFLSSRESWWNDLHSTLFIKLLAVLNLFTGAHYSVNTVFFAMLAMAGSAALYRVFRQVYPGAEKAVIAGTFLLPSYLFWTSGLFRDAPAALAFAGALLAVYSALKNGWKAKYVAGLLAALLLLLLFRNTMLVILLPALAAWIAAHRSGRHPFLVFGAFYAGYALLFFGLRYLHPALDFPRIVAEKQEDFFNLIGSSRVDVPHLKPTVASFLANTPHALALTLFRPWPGDVYNEFIAVACIETYVLLALFAWWIFRHRPMGRPVPFIAFCLFFSLSVFLMIGFTVNFLGALVRYRGLLLPLLVTPLLATLRLPGVTKKHI